ncbi:hypothetical protein GH714_006091 [Hevea brasiliensis]|nr:hypothetical protein GH714_006091 [Hevea brasiliensis]
MSSTIQEKLFFLNCTNGQLYVGTRNLATDLEMMPCVPSGLLMSVHDFNSDQQQDAMLLWLEEHGRRLQDGIIKLQEEGNVRAICQFPEEPPLCSTAITNGVKVRASAVFVPEAADLEDSSEKYWFAYSIRMSLLPEGCFINGMYFGSCQLQRRHWIIYANGNIVSDVSGEAVIGKYPLLLPGERDFVYQSCTPLSTSSGSIEGSFTFVPGRLVDQKELHLKLKWHDSPFNFQTTFSDGHWSLNSCNNAHPIVYHPPALVNMCGKVVCLRKTLL